MKFSRASASVSCKHSQCTILFMGTNFHNVEIPILLKAMILSNSDSGYKDAIIDGEFNGSKMKLTDIKFC